MIPIPDDPAVLMDAAREALEPPGCVEVVGRVEQTFGVPIGSSTNTWRMQGRMEDGAWTALSWEPIGEVDTSFSTQFGTGRWELPFLPPLFGTFPDGEGLFEEAEGILDVLTDLVQDEVTTEYAEVDAEELVMHRIFHDGLRRDNLGAVGFRRADLAPRWWTLVVEKPVKGDGLGKLTDVDLRLELNEQGQFGVERFSGQVRAAVFRLRIDRSITYESVSACAAPLSPPAEAPPPGSPPPGPPPPG